LRNQAPPAPGTAIETPGPGTTARQAQEALDRYNRAMEQLKAVDWAGFGKHMDAMRGVFGRHEPAIKRALDCRSPVREVARLQSERFHSGLRKRSPRFHLFVRSHHRSDNRRGGFRIPFRHEIDRANGWTAA
jgi:hypothetical protein